jgi:outer membrane protein OmpA-like peptidoglycan-associated protein
MPRPAALLAIILFAMSLPACSLFSGKPRNFEVYFEEWSAGLDEAALGTIATAAKFAEAHPDQVVTVTGYADPIGSKAANVDMSRTRAQVVMDQLVQDGVDRSRIRLTARGRTNFMLTSQESRRVDISVTGL